MKKILTLFFAASVAAFPQIFSFGAKAGVPATDAFNTGAPGGPAFERLSYFASTRRYTVGPTAELHLPFRLSVEFDALYKRVGFNKNQSGIDTLAQSATTANSWEFPLLAKYRLTGGPIRPYIDGGVSFDHLSGVTQLTRLTVFPSHVTTSTGTSPELMNSFREGGVIGGGLELHLGFLRLSPEIRYTRWGQDSFRDLDNGSLLRSSPNQAEFLVGITF